MREFLPALVLMIVGAFFAALSWSRWQRLGPMETTFPNICTCGYDMAGLGRWARCPECGKFTRKQFKDPRRLNEIEASNLLIVSLIFDSLAILAFFDAVMGWPIETPFLLGLSLFALFIPTIAGWGAPPKTMAVHTHMRISIIFFSVSLLPILGFAMIEYTGGWGFKRGDWHVIPIIHGVGSSCLIQIPFLIAVRIVAASRARRHSATTPPPSSDV